MSAQNTTKHGGRTVGPPVNDLIVVRATIQALHWDRGRRPLLLHHHPRLSYPGLIALRAHCGRDARGPSKSLESSIPPALTSPSDNLNTFLNSISFLNASTISPNRIVLF